MTKKNLFIRYIESFFLNNWWVIASVLLFFGIYESASYHTMQAKRELLQKITTIENQKLAAKAMIARFDQELASVSDPAWIEMLLIRKLGLVPKGQKKILYRWH